MVYIFQIENIGNFLYRTILHWAVGKLCSHWPMFVHQNRILDHIMCNRHQYLFVQVYNIQYLLHLMKPMKQRMYNPFLYNHLEQIWNSFLNSILVLEGNYIMHHRFLQLLSPLLCLLFPNVHRQLHLHLKIKPFQN